MGSQPRARRWWPLAITAAGLTAAHINDVPDRPLLAIETSHCPPAPIAEPIECPAAPDVPACPEPAEPEPPPPPDPGEAIVAGAPRGPLAGVAVSRRHRDTIAVWSGSQLAVSRDGGARFAVHGQGAGESIVAAAIDRRGAVFAITRGGDPDVSRMTEIAAAAASTWELDGVAAVDHFAISGGRLVIHGGGALSVSRDRGRTWTTREAPRGNSANEIHVGDGGAVQLLTGHEASCGGGYQKRYASTLAGAEWSEAPWPFDIPTGAFLGPAAWGYGYEQDCAGTAGLCGVRDGAPVLLRAIAEYPSTEHWASNGRVVVAALDKTLLRVRRDRAEPLGEVPAGLSQLAVDAVDRPLAIANGYLVRWTPAGWRSLFPSQAAVSLAR
jgi:hypothetical protein